MTHAATLTTDRPLPRQATHIAWFAAAAAIAFAVPFVFASTLELDNDAYYAVYFAVALATVGAYMAVTGVRPVMSRNAIVISLALGIGAAAFVVANVLGKDGTARPDQPRLAFELLWRGALYGAVDAILLSAFPALVAYALLDRDLTGAKKRVAFAAVSLVLTIIITATYHLGYDQYRDDGVKIGPPEIGNSVISIPTLATANPVGSIVAHTAMHVTAVYHSYETDTFLPPQTTVED